MIEDDHTIIDKPTKVHIDDTFSKLSKQETDNLDDKQTFGANTKILMNSY